MLNNGAGAIANGLVAGIKDDNKFSHIDSNFHNDNNKNRLWNSHDRNPTCNNNFHLSHNSNNRHSIVVILPLLLLVGVAVFTRNHHTNDLITHLHETHNSNRPILTITMLVISMHNTKVAASARVNHTPRRRNLNRPARDSIPVSISSLFATSGFSA